MKKEMIDPRKGADRSAEGSKTHRVTRRRFLQISGGAAAAAAVGTTIYLLHENASQNELKSVPQPISGLPAAQPFDGKDQLLSPEEAAAMRHLRHRRQFLDGTNDSILGSSEPCERDCIQSLIAHQL